MSLFLLLLAQLCIAHALCDYPLQGDFLAKAKNPAAPLPGIPWGWAMSAHCAIHAGAVGYITGSAFLAACEFVAHFGADYAKCDGRLSFSQDQSIHLLCKVSFAVCAAVEAAQ